MRAPLLSRLQYMVWGQIPSLPDRIVSTLQKRQLVKMLRYAHERSPYHRRRIPREAISKADLNLVPITRRVDLQLHADDMKVPGLPPWMYRNKGGTSGSTGEPVHFYCSTFGQTTYEMEQWYVHNKLWRFLIQRGYSMRQIFNEVPMVELRAIRASDHPMHLYLRAEDALNDPINMIERVKKHKPLVFGCYGSFNLAFCRALHEHNAVGTVRIPYIVNTGETLLPEQRAFIEETLDGVVINRYGMEEFYWAIACEREPGQGLVNYAESYIIEIVDDNGSPVEVGEIGRVIVTDLTNYTMPFIRYDTGDSGRLLERMGPYIRFELVGRNIKLEFPGGTLLYYLVNGVFSYHARAITQYQFIKKSDTELEVKLAVTNQYHDAVSRDVIVRLRELIGPNVNISVNIVPHIERTSRGKTKVFVDETTQAAK